VGPGGAQEFFGISPDLTCLGKIIGGGLPVGAYGGKKEIMERMAPEGDIYQAGTLSGNPLAMAAGLATLNILRKGEIYAELEDKGKALFFGLKDAAEAAGLNVVINHIGSMGSVFFTEVPVMDFATATKSDVDMFKRYYSSMMEKGIYLAPSPFEASFVSIAHDKKIIGETVSLAAESFASI
jgi:glutamate-1-semialdehyde 2,1-aminomutase